MTTLDETRDEVQLSAGLVTRLQGRFAFEQSSTNDDQPHRVDVAGTNERLVLGSTGLGHFTTIRPGDARLLRVEDILTNASALEPKDIVWLLLCGGMSFRTGGQIHPLKAMDASDGQSTLLARQLMRLRRSPLRDSACLVVATPFNEDALREHLARLPDGDRYKLYAGGLAPRLSPLQTRTTPPIVVRDGAGRIAFNPIGHLEALRWFVLTGWLHRCAAAKVVVTASYSNWGTLFDETTAAISGATHRLAQGDGSACAVIEVTHARSPAEKGSVLASLGNDPDDVRLIKPEYGRQEARRGDPEQVLISTNTWHFSISGLLTRLAQASHGSVGTRGEDGVLELLADASCHRRRRELADLFEKAFPIEPQLIATTAGPSAAFIRIERDLDQLSLIPGPSLVRAVVVPRARAVFLKTPSDFENPDKLAYLNA